MAEQHYTIYVCPDHHARGLYAREGKPCLVCGEARYTALDVVDARHVEVGRTRAERAEDSYRHLRGTLIAAFNLPLDAEAATCAEAIERAADCIERQPCECDLQQLGDGTVADVYGACPRCKALGRVRDRETAR
ncbi:MAG: hypothetical protein ACRDLD_02325 [Thermoleophilaceae bacterium]